MLIILGKYQVPDLDEAAAFAVRATIRPAAASALAKVVVNLAARTTGPGLTGGPPEIVLLPKAKDPLLGEAHFLPVIESLIIIEEYGDPEALLGQPQPLGHKLPGPLDGLSFKIVAHAEITQHLEEGEVLGIAHGVDIRGAETLLAGCHAGVAGGCFTGEVALELDHTCSG